MNKETNKNQPAVCSGHDVLGVLPERILIGNRDFLWLQVINPPVPRVTLYLYLVSFHKSNPKKEKPLIWENLP